jgi:coenzyme F420-reducing hydrogenase beta subunit
LLDKKKKKIMMKLFMKLINNKLLKDKTGQTTKPLLKFHKLEKLKLKRNMSKNEEIK